ncbi:MAG: hypothetical protein MI794_11755 [Pseudomonadales bacterium]|nr:hypothetical protein [Pseudomonadales bacterium]
MIILRGCSRGGELLAMLLAFPTPAYATTQCPLEFGQKDPLVNGLGWLVVAVGVVIGGLLFSYLIRHTRSMRGFSRASVIALGFVGMTLVWLSGLALALAYFFLPC